MYIYEKEIVMYKEIKGYEGLYELRSDGLLHIFKRKYCNEKQTYGRKAGKYLKFGLSKNNTEELKLAHVLMWETFVGPIPEGYEIHHKNHIGTDNRLENLELLTKEEHNEIHKTDRSKGTTKALSKPVMQYTLDGELVKRYDSGSEASRETGINQSHISSCCIGKRNKAGGYIWKYAA